MSFAKIFSFTQLNFTVFVAVVRAKKKYVMYKSFDWCDGFEVHALLEVFLDNVLIVEGGMSLTSSKEVHVEKKAEKKY